LSTDDGLPFNFPEHRRVNLVFQSYGMSVFENVAYGLKSMKLARGEIKAVVRAMLELAGLEGLAERPAMGLHFGHSEKRYKLFRMDPMQLQDR
jgi:ABC-type Fe3+/spermidine/putrescine transport system ATPase subunit